MARLRRVVAEGYPHHVTQQGNFRRSVFLDDEDRGAYLALLAKRLEFAIKPSPGLPMEFAIRQQKSVFAAENRYSGGKAGRKCGRSFPYSPKPFRK